MKIDAVLARHPWPWRPIHYTDSSGNERVMQVQDSVGYCVFEDTVTPDVLDAILELVAAHVARSTTQATHSEECWRWHHGCAVARIEALPRAGGDHG